jgi:hypothetical protein
MARGWTAVGVEHAAAVEKLMHAAGLADARVALRAFTALHALGVPSRPAARWLAELGHTTAVDWVRAGFTELEDALVWRRSRFSAERASRWARVAAGPDSARAWMRHVSDAPEDAARWVAAGVEDPREAALLSDAGVAPEEIAEWTLLGVTGSSSVLGWRARWDAETAHRWVGALDVALDEAWVWSSSVDGDLARATAWHESGIRAPGEIAAWAAAGCDVGEAAAWLRAGFGPEQARNWSSAGYDAASGPAWAAVVDTPHSADQWQSVCSGGPEEVGAWVRSGVEEPARALELQRIGLTGRSYALLVDEHEPSELPKALRRQAIHHAGLALEDDLITLDVTAFAASEAVARLDVLSQAAARSDEAALKVRHGWPHLTLELMAAVPDARYVRGGEKAALWKALREGGLPAVRQGDSGAPDAVHWLTEEGNSTILKLTQLPVTDEFLSLERLGSE